MELTGKTILTTRAASQSGDLRSRLEALGARVIECPVIEIVPVDDWSAVDAAVRQLGSYDWLIFTSANAVEYFMKRVQAANARCSVSIAAVGSATAHRLRQWGLEAAIIPKQFRAEGLIEAMPPTLFRTAILFPRAEVARDVLPTELRRRGARVDIVTVYRTIRPDPGARSIADILAAEAIDCIVFTSPSTIRYAAESAGELFLDVLKDVPVAVIGPVTRDAAVEAGLSVPILPAESTVVSLVEAIRNLLGSSAPRR
jgi:uroporphyrinogen III methyltransferase/synthase